MLPETIAAEQRFQSRRHRAAKETPVQVLAAGADLSELSPWYPRARCSVATAMTTVALFSASCSNPSSPSQQAINPSPSIACPAPPPAVTATNGRSATVTYGTPTVTGGTAPVSTSCIPPSGSLFNAGPTGVTCSAVDAAHRTAECSFTVSVVGSAPRLTVTTILAFGDSITEGEVPVAGEFSIRPTYVETDKSYPADLSVLLAQRYTAQSVTRVDAFSLGAGNTTNCATNPPRPTSSGIVIINAGCFGERAQDAATLARLNGKLAAYNPDLVLLLEGANDLDPSMPDASIAAGVQGVGTLIAAARSRGAHVMVGTLPPEIGTALTHGGAPNLVAPFNTQLMATALSAGAAVIDLYSDMVTDAKDWISPYDGVHPTEAGYQEMAQVWFYSLWRNFESSPSSSMTPYTLRRSSRGTLPGRSR
jgi:lysophospholipase L1-like esterase